MGSERAGPYLEAGREDVRVAANAFLSHSLWGIWDRSRCSPLASAFCLGLLGGMAGREGVQAQATELPAFSTRRSVTSGWQ